MKMMKMFSWVVLGSMAMTATPARAGSGSLDKELISEVVRAHIDEVRQCYNEGLTRKPELAGRITVDFTISPSGSVSASEVSPGSTLGDAAVEACVAAAVKRWVFPKPEGGAVLVRYPFSFEPG
jgi:TonB family protein